MTHTNSTFRGTIFNKKKGLLWTWILSRRLSIRLPGSCTGRCLWNEDALMMHGWVNHRECFSFKKKKQTDTAGISPNKVIFLLVYSLQLPLIKAMITFSIHIFIFPPSWASLNLCNFVLSAAFKCYLFHIICTI